MSPTKYGGANWVGRYTGQFTNWLTISAAYGKNNNRSNSQPSDITSPYILEQRFGSSNVIGNPVNAIKTQEDTREFYHGDVDIYFSLFGSQHVKAGYDRENPTSLNTSTYTGGVAYTYDRATAINPYGLAVGTDFVTARTYVNGGTFRSRNEAFCIEGNWSLLNDQLTLQLGLRSDKFSNRNVAGDIYYDSGNNYQPRIGATLDPFGDGRTKLYGSFGRYYLPIATNTNIRLGGAELDYDQLYILTGLNSDNTPILGAPIANRQCSLPPGRHGQ